MSEYLLCPNCNTDESQSCTFYIKEKTKGVWTGAAVGGLLGGGIGALIGSVINSYPEVKITCKNCGYSYVTSSEYYIRHY